jgi:HlyD family secretion protein
LQKFHALTGLQPGGGSGSPIALPPGIEMPRDMVEKMLPTDVVGLAPALQYATPALEPRLQAAGTPRRDVAG